MREYPVYEYRMRYAVPDELPQITRVLREQAGDPVSEVGPQGAVSGVTAAPEDVSPSSP